MGVKFMLNTRIVAPGAEDEPEELGEVNTRQHCDLLDEWHDAIFLGVGLGDTNKLDIPGEDLDGVYDALDFIERIKTREWTGVPLGRTVAVIGAGNTAIDAVTQAKRLGAEKVIMVYRRTEKRCVGLRLRDGTCSQGRHRIRLAGGADRDPVGREREHRLTLRCEKTDGSLRAV